MKTEKSRWLILALSVLVNLCNGVGYAWSVFAEPLRAQFGWSPEQLALAFTINMGFVAPFAMIASARIQKWKGARFSIILGSILTAAGLILTSFANSLATLYLFYGVVSGFGFNISFGAVISNTVKFFPDRKGLSLGLVIAGFGSGAIVMAPVVSLLIAAPGIGVMGAFRYLGVSLMLIVIAAGFLIENAPSQPAATAGNVAGKPASSALEGKTWKQLPATPTFYLIVLLFITASFTGLTVISSVSPMAQKMFFLTPQTAALIVGIVSVSNALGRIGGGALNDRIGNANVLAAIYGVSILALLILVTFKTVSAFVPAMVLIGAAYGACMVTFPAIVSTRFGTEGFTANYGVTFFAYALSSFLAPRIAAMIRTANNGDYSAAFIVASFVAAAGLALSFMFKKIEAGKR
ncbi:MAG: OFA family MFS transporter [Treponemataceae bacterium]